MEIKVIKSFEFEAAHMLPGYPGACSKLHGHSYKLQIGVKGNVEEATGMVMDFKELKEIVNDRIITPLDHAYLNDLGFHMPTAENIAIWILRELEAFSVPVCLVRLWETADSYAEVTE
jgi:6-pyruvoyltetrahydropterin/6-carboxytetrahydropterin synthase